MIQVFKKRKKNKSLKGNISILFIFILLATSTIVLLAMNEIRHLMEYGDTTDDYFKMYYLGKAGIELAMTEVQTRGYGFNWSIDSGNAILQNFDTGAIEENEPQNYFTYTITGRPTQFTAQLQTGDIFMIPLFYDSGNNNTSTTISHSGVLATGEYYYNYDSPSNITLSGFNNEVLFTLMQFDSGLNTMEEICQYTGETLKWEENSCFTGILKAINTSNSSNNRAYLAIKNYTGHDTLTITGQDSSSNEGALGVPLYKSEITVNAHYQDEEMGMEITYNRPVPAFMGMSAGLTNS